MLHRVFIAVNLPAKIKAELYSLRERYSELPARWTAPDNLHVTLAFLGNMSDKEIEETRVIVKETAGRHKPFSFTLSKIAYGPTDKQSRLDSQSARQARLDEPQARQARLDSQSARQARLDSQSARQASMVWAIGETPKELVNLQKDLLNALNRKGDYPFTLHVTLARLNEWAFQNIDPEDRPDINQDIAVEIPVSSVEIMESRLKPRGAEYSVIESAPL